MIKITQTNVAFTRTQIKVIQKTLFVSSAQKMEQVREELANLYNVKIKQITFTFGQMSRRRVY